MNFTYKLIIVALLVIIAMLAIRSCLNKSKEVDSVTQLQDIKEDSLTYWKDAAGREHASKRIAEGTITAIRAVYGKEIDSLTRIIKVKDKAIQGFVALGTVNSSRVVPIIDTIYVDSSKVVRFTYSDRWLSLHGELAKEPYVEYSVYDSITLVTYRKKKGLFREETYIDGFTQNPHTQITGLTGVRVSQPPAKRFGIGPYAGYGFNGSTWRLNAGISIQYSLIKF